MHRLPYFKNRKHKTPNQELKTEDGKYVDTVYAPIEGKSKTGVIHELKKQSQEYRSPSVASLVEDAFWQIYANRYMSVLFEIPYVERIIVRAIVFYKNGENEWDVKLQEHILSIKKAKEIDKVFSDDGEVLDNSKELIKVKNAREEFLKKEEANSLDALIAKYS